MKTLFTNFLQSEFSPRRVPKPVISTEKRKAKKITLKIFVSKKLVLKSVASGFEYFFNFSFIFFKKICED